MASPLLLLLLLLHYSEAEPAGSPESPNPFTERAAFIRYWNRKVPNSLPHPSFFLSKLTPLSAPDAAKFSSLAPSNLSSLLPKFCAAAALLCPLSPSLSSHTRGSPFSSYENGNFTNYDNDAAGGRSSFSNYSENLVLANDHFRRYGRDSVGHDDDFSSYGPNGNLVTTNFTSYGTKTAGAADNFTSYANSANVPDLGFSNYAAESSGRDALFSQYSDDANSGDQSFSGYGKNGNGAVADFVTYANNSNTIGNTFKNYGEEGKGNGQTFASYGQNGNVPENSFRSYGSGTHGGFDQFTAYRDQSNVGDDSFASYEKGGNDGSALFTNYGNSSNPGSESFKSYGQRSSNDHIIFKEYFADDTSFKVYPKSGVDFKEYYNSTSSSTTMANRWVEEGKFFREKSLRKGTIMPMPDIRDRMPPRAFLPRSIARKIPFSSAAVTEIFLIPPDSAMGNAMESTMADCDRTPSRGETKRCITSAEDMIDFAVSVLGNNIAAEILAVESREKINQGTAICHLDTSDWGPTHGAFLALGPGPGKIEVCHWIFEGDMTWTVADRL
ncbi:hypothetical protein HPP92_006172 [Vanilla planifolia]|uniref:BURP domain-containing protein n=1 Tax=Vanilla planifolia TaxID=51239 RepID=A0A835V9R8_VANPL|nr:hypothetical protein HPP92_006172 [Vanilla planifolia]